MNSTAQASFQAAGHRPATRIVLIYAVAGGAWILLSDRVLELIFVPGPSALAGGQTIKGLAFIAITAASLYALIRHYTRRQLESEVGRALSETLSANLVASVRDYAIYRLDRDGRIVTWNEGATRINGYSAGEIVGQNFEQLFPEEDRRAGKPHAALQAAAQEEHWHDEGWRVRKDGSRFWADGTLTAISDRNGALAGFLKVTRDLTERKAVEQSLADAKAALEEQTRILQSVFDSMGEGVVVADENGKLTLFNPAAERIYGKGVLDAPASRWAELYQVYVADGSRLKTPDEFALMQAIRGRSIDGAESLIRGTHAPDGILISFNARPIVDSAGRPRGAVAVVRDITRERAREVELRGRVHQIEAVARLSHEALGSPELGRLFELAVGLLATTLNTDMADILELELDGANLVLRAAVGFKAGNVGRFRVSAGPNTFAGAILQAGKPLILRDLPNEPDYAGSRLLAEHGVVSGIGVAIPGMHGTYGLLAALSPRQRAFSEDDLGFLQSVAHVLSAAILRHENEVLLREQRARLRSIVDNVVDGIVSISDEGIIENVNRSAERIFGYDESELRGRNVNVLMPEPHHSRHDSYIDSYLRTGVAKLIGRTRELIGRRRDGKTFPLELSVGEVRLGDRHVFIATLRDLTERKSTEEQLRQAQKMEAIGQLTGGVAHDFNNLLTVILGNTELLAGELADNPRLARMAGMARSAAERGAALTQRLLAFGRRQPLLPESIDLNAVVQGMDELLRRTLGEHIEIRTILSADLHSANADRAQLETAILNLALNARDAMSNGGKLIIESANIQLDADYAATRPEVTAGPYVMLSITDTGAGMPPEVRDRAFEPFFTTKDVGKGSGLGLSMVYGFAKQSRGHVSLYSEVGHGTTVKLYLPEADVEAVRATSPARTAPAPTGNETVLVVEDDRDVRDYVVRLLKTLGYNVAEAATGPDALRWLEAGTPVDLVFTDLVMPDGMTGMDLAAAALKSRPELRIMYTSGYSEEAAVHGGKLQPGVRLLRKPYRKDDLARAVRAAIEGPPGDRHRPAVNGH